MYVCMYIVYCMYVSLVSSFAGSPLKRRPNVILVLTCHLGMVHEAALVWGWPFWRQRWPSLRLSASSGLCHLQRQRWGYIYGICHYNVILPFCFNKTFWPFYCPFFISFYFVFARFHWRVQLGVHTETISCFRVFAEPNDWKYYETFRGGLAQIHSIWRVTEMYSPTMEHQPHWYELELLATLPFWPTLCKHFIHCQLSLLTAELFIGELHNATVTFTAIPSID